MGSMIHLGIGRLEIDWGKNSYFHNHSVLFQPGDLGRAYYYYADDYKTKKPAYVAKLSKIVPRLELMGYSIPNCEDTFNQAVKDHPAYHKPVKIDFNLFKKALMAVDVDRVMTQDDYSTGNFDFGELAKHLLVDPQFSKVLGKKAGMSKDRGVFFENLDCYVVLRLLAENPANLDKDVTWGFHDVVSGGHVKRKDIYEKLSSYSKYLVVTEGTSDSDILRKSLAKLYPGIADFFDFIDVDEKYPFSGTGNLGNFCIGLSIIKIKNKVVFVIDNDSAGLEAMDRILKAKNMPENIKTYLLPSLPEFRDFLTHGPTGNVYSNINGKAVSIEMFLDLNYNQSSPPVIEWTSLHRKTETYQGELRHKESYVKEFHDSFEKPGYNLQKLKAVWEGIIGLCSR